jgi:nicotinamidase-related amidase
MSQTKRILGILIVGLTALSTCALATCQAALLVINLDLVTLSFAGAGDPYPEDWRTADDRYVVDANAELIAAARAAGLLIVYLYGNYDYVPAEEMRTFPTQIAPQEGDLLIARPGPYQDVFRDTGLHEILRAHGIHWLIISGLNTAYCVKMSAYRADALGYEVIVAADAHSGGDPGLAEQYNTRFWPYYGTSVVPTAEIDFTGLCAGESD